MPSRSHPLPARASVIAVSSGLCLLLGVIGSVPPAAGTIVPISIKGRNPAQEVTFRLDSMIAKAPAPLSGKCVEVVYEGVLELEAHLRRPGDKQLYRSRQRFIADGRGGVRLDWTTWLDGDSAGAPESWLLATSGVGPSPTLFHRAAPESTWRGVRADRREQALAQVTAGMPWEVARQISVLTGLGQVGVTGGGPGGVWNLVPPRSVGSRVLTLRPVDSAVLSLMTTYPHPRLGDVRDGVLYSYQGPGLVPAEFRQIVHERDQQWAMTERRVSYRTDAPEEPFGLPSLFWPPEPADSIASSVNLVPLAPGLWSADVEGLDTRSVVVEFADKLAVLEAAIGSENGERIVDAAKRQWPSKPIRYFLFSHHHPHYAGGVRAFVAEGATVVTTPGNEHFVRQMSDLAFTLRPDRLTRAKRPLSMQTFAKRFEIADSTNRLVAVNIGPRSDHTNEFVVFWFPKQRMLFETEQGWVTVDGKTRASRRAERFLKALDDERLVADRIVQSWPMRGNPAVLTRVELDSLVTLRGRTLPQAAAGAK